MRIHVGFWTLKVNCTQYGFLRQAAFKNARAMYFFETKRGGNRFWLVSFNILLFVLFYGGLPWSLSISPGSLYIWGSLMSPVGKVDVSNSITYLYQKPIILWYVFRCGFKNKYQKRLDYMLKINIAILDSILSIIEGGPYDHLMSTRIFTLVTNKIFVWTPKSRRKVAYCLDLDILTISC